MREKWSDERLDDLNERVGDGFAQVGRRFERVEGEIKDLRQEMNTRFDALQRAMFQGVVGLCGVFGTGFAALIVLVATQV